MDEHLDQDYLAAENAIRRGQPIGAEIKPCSCFQTPPKYRQCYGTCKDAVDLVARAIKLARDEGGQLQRAEKDEAYRQRNYLVAGLAHCFPAGIRATNIEGWEPDWHGCVYIDLPTGQISYHYHDSQAHLFANLPPYTKEYDGHDKETVHKRLLALGSWR